MLFSCLSFLSLSLPILRSLYHIYEKCEAPKKLFPVPFPEEGEVYDYEFVKEGLGEWVAWSTKLADAKPIPKDAQFNSIIIPTVDTIRTTYLMDVCIKHEKPCLFVGPTGTGKSVYIQVRPGRASEQYYLRRA